MYLFNPAGSNFRLFSYLQLHPSPVEPQNTNRKFQSFIIKLFLLIKKKKEKEKEKKEIPCIKL
jgi:hypothetical protein